MALTDAFGASLVLYPCWRLMCVKSNGEHAQTLKVEKDVLALVNELRVGRRVGEDFRAWHT